MFISRYSAIKYLVLGTFLILWSLFLAQVHENAFNRHVVTIGLEVQEQVAHKILMDPLGGYASFNRRQGTSTSRPAPTQQTTTRPVTTPTSRPVITPTPRTTTSPRVTTPTTTRSTTTTTRSTTSSTTSRSTTTISTTPKSTTTISTTSKSTTTISTTSKSTTSKSTTSKSTSKSTTSRSSTTRSTTIRSSTTKPTTRPTTTTKPTTRPTTTISRTTTRKSTTVTAHITTPPRPTGSRPPPTTYPSTEVPTVIIQVSTKIYTAVEPTDEPSISSTPRPTVTQSVAPSDPDIFYSPSDWSSSNNPLADSNVTSPSAQNFTLEPSCDDSIVGNRPGASIMYEFIGTGIDLTTVPSSGCGIFSVAIDDEEPVELDGYSDDPDIDSLTCQLRTSFRRTELNNGVHMIVIQIVGASERASSSDATKFELGGLTYLAPDPEPEPEPQSQSKSLPIGAIVGAVVGGLVVLGLVVYFVIRRRRQQVQDTAPLASTLGSPHAATSASPTSPSMPFSPFADPAMVSGRPTSGPSSRFATSTSFPSVPQQPWLNSNQSSSRPVSMDPFNPEGSSPFVTRNRNSRHSSMVPNTDPVGSSPLRQNVSFGAVDRRTPILDPSAEYIAPLTAAGVTTQGRIPSLGDRSSSATNSWSKGNNDGPFDPYAPYPSTTQISTFKPDDRPSTFRDHKDPFDPYAEDLFITEKPTPGPGDRSSKISSPSRHKYPLNVEASDPFMTRQMSPRSPAMDPSPEYSPQATIGTLPASASTFQRATTRPLPQPGIASSSKMTYSGAFSAAR